MTKVNVHLSGLLLCLSLSFMPLLLEATPTVSCGTTISSFPYTESFETGLGDWSNGGPNNLWTRDSGGTPSGGTGPSSGYQSTYYVFTEASGNNVGYPNKETVLVGPCFDLSGATNALFSFYYHMNGDNMGDLSVEVSNDAGANWTTVWTRSGLQDNLWWRAEVDLTSYINQSIKVRFKGITGTFWSSDMAIDAIELSINQSTTPASCTFIIGSFPYSESFESGEGLWTEISAYNIWQRDNLTTLSGGTGPSAAIDGSYYMYTEASAPNYANKTSYFEGPCFDLSGLANASFLFKYHMLGVDINYISFEISTDGGNNWTSIWSRRGEQGSQWKNAAIDLSSYVGQIIKVRFFTETGTFYKGDIAIDAIELLATGTNSNNDCGPLVTQFPYVESFENDWGLWTEGSSGVLARNAGVTTTNLTGPSLASDGVFYVYSEATNNEESISSFISPCIDLGAMQAANFSFKYHMYGADIESLSLQISTNQGATYSNIWSKTGNQGNSWQTAVVDLNAYVGNIIQLRFSFAIGEGPLSDMAIDALFLDATETVGNVNLAGSIQFAVDDSCGTYDPVQGANLRAVDVNSSAVNVLSTNSLGDFAYTIQSSTLDLLPYVNTPAWDNGLSLTDVLSLQKHINDQEYLKCPLPRLAGDVNNDGNLTQADIDEIQDLRLGNISSFSGVPNWRFVPKHYVDQTELSPDLIFIPQFWSAAPESYQGDEYPFMGKMRMAGYAYSYNSGSTWLDTLQNQALSADECNSINWGFYAIKSGDINGSASHTFTPDPSGTSSRPAPTRTVYQALRPQNSTQLRAANRKYNVKIIAVAERPMEAYQLQISFDEEVIAVQQIKPNRENLKQTEAKNYGQLKQGLRGGVLQTIWINDFKEDPNGKAIQQGITLFEFEVKSKAELAQVKQAIRIDNIGMESLFYGEKGKLGAVDLQILVEPTK